MRDELRVARDRLAARERFLSIVLQRVPVGVLVWTDEGELVTANPAARDILAGFSPGDDAGAPARLRQALVAAPGPGETEHGPPRHPFEIAGIDRGVGGEDDHAGAVAVGGRDLEVVDGADLVTIGEHALGDRNSSTHVPHSRESPRPGTIRTAHHVWGDARSGGPRR